MNPIQLLKDHHPILAIITRTTKIKRFFNEAEITEKIKQILQKGKIIVNERVMEGTAFQTVIQHSLGHGKEKEKVYNRLQFQHDGQDQNYHLCCETTKKRNGYYEYELISDRCESLAPNERRIIHRKKSCLADERLRGYQRTSSFTQMTSSFYNEDTLMAHFIMFSSISKDKNFQTGEERICPCSFCYPKICDTYFRLPDGKMLHCAQTVKDGKVLKAYHEIGKPALDTFKTTYIAISEEEWNQYVSGLSYDTSTVFQPQKILKKN